MKQREKKPEQPAVTEERSSRGTPDSENPKTNDDAPKGNKPAEVENPPAANQPDVKRRFRETGLPTHYIERRKFPRIQTEPPPPPAPPRMADYAAIIGMPELDEIRFLARHLQGKTVKMVNSTEVGGGVAESMNRLVPLMNELEVPTKWEVITGGNDFYEITKGFHNALHGGEYNLNQQIQDIFLSCNEQNRQRMEFVEDLFVIHDPQPVGLVRSKAETRGRWIWRCHIDLSNPNPEVWDFLKPMVEQYDASIFSSPAFTRQLSVPQYLFYPSIDPLSEKHKDLEESYINQGCDDCRIELCRSTLTELPRF